MAVQGRISIQITVHCESGQEVQVKAYPQTLLQQIFSAFVEALSLELHKLVFLDTDGVKLRSQQSLQQADILNGDIIDCMFRQLGD